LHIDRSQRDRSYQVHLGGDYCNYGNLILDSDRPEESLAWSEKAISTLSAVYGQDHRLARAREYLRNSHSCRARAYDRLQKYAEAIRDWDRAIELSEKADQPRFQVLRATSRSHTGHLGEAVTEVAELTKAPVVGAPGSPAWTAGQWYDFACVYSVGSGNIADKKQEYANRAMELLQQSVQAGYNNAAHMMKDSDLDALRDREDFKKLIAELEAKAKQPDPAKRP
jgi:tetratricopeptide (TPR) repeat protein